jgi:hypothetical protein
VRPLAPPPVKRSLSPSFSLATASLDSNDRRQISATINLGDDSSSDEYSVQSEDSCVHVGGCFYKPTDSYLITLADAENISVYCTLYNVLSDGKCGYYAVQRSMRKWFVKYAPECLEFEEGLADQLDESYYEGVLAFRRDLRQFMDDNRNRIIGLEGFSPALLDAVQAHDKRFIQKHTRWCLIACHQTCTRIRRVSTTVCYSEE